MKISNSVYWMKIFNCSYYWYIFQFLYFFRWKVLKYKIEQHLFFYFSIIFTSWKKSIHFDIDTYWYQKSHWYDIKTFSSMRRIFFNRWNLLKRWNVQFTKESRFNKLGRLWSQNKIVFFWFNLCSLKKTIKFYKIKSCRITYGT